MVPAIATRSDPSAEASSEKVAMVVSSPPNAPVAEPSMMMV
jgi:hypothetical protein